MLTVALPIVTSYRKSITMLSIESNVLSKWFEGTYKSLYDHYCYDLICTAYSFALFLQAWVVFFPYCNGRPCLNLSTSHHMQRLEREMRGSGRRRRASVPSLSSGILHRERGSHFASALQPETFFPQFLGISPHTSEHFGWFHCIDFVFCLTKSVI